MSSTGNADRLRDAIALLEAMALGRAVVAARVGGIPEVIQDGVSGLLVPPSDASALSNALIRLLLDADLRARIGAEARSLVEREWSSVRMITRTAAVYEEVLAARGPRRSGR